MRLFLILPLVALSLSGCFVSAQDGDKKVVYSENGDRGDYNRNHCPPGHAKKGWC